MSKEMREQINKVKNFGQFLNENNINNINNNHLIEVTPNKYILHTSNPFFRDKISKEGLIPKGISATWLSDTKIDGEVIFAVNKNNDAWDSTYDDDIYRIDTTKLNNKWYNDPNFEADGIHIITFDYIPLNAIKLIYKGVNDMLEESINIENPNSDEYNKIFVDGE